MAETSTFVKIDRNILKWRWFKSAKTLQLFLYLILNANIKEAGFETITVQRGQLVTSYPTLATATSMSVQSVRTAMQHLKSTGEITVKSHPKFSVITVLNYDKYQACQQGEQQPNNRQATGKQQANNRQVATIKEYKELKNERSKEDISLSDDGYSDNFEIFWHEYPKKVGKKEAWRAFKKVREPLSILLMAIRNQKESDMWTKENGRFIPNPATWLNQGRWEDQVTKHSGNPYLRILEEQNDNTRSSEDSSLDFIVI